MAAQPQLESAAQDGHCSSALADCATTGMDDYVDGSDTVAVAVAAGSEERLKRALIKRAGRGCELAGRERLEGLMDADDDTSKGKRGDDAVSGPLSSREIEWVCMKSGKEERSCERTRGRG